MSDIKPCPCGQTPSELGIDADHEQPKWALVYGDCCGEWHVEYKNGYLPLDEPEAMRLARQAWNDAPRAQTFRPTLRRLATEYGGDSLPEFLAWLDERLESGDE